MVDGYVLSYQEHKIKPYKAIYNVLLERYNLIPNECIFIDDNQNNIETGNSMGIISKKVEPDDYYSIIKIIKELIRFNKNPVFFISDIIPLLFRVY